MILEYQAKKDMKILFMNKYHPT